MIAYEELAAALERWRIRNGLPGTPPLFADGPRKAGAAAAASYSAPAATYAPPLVAAPAPAPYMPRTAPPMPPPPSPETLDEDLGDLAEADVLDDEAHLDPDGPDFAVPFSATSRPAPLAEPLSDDERESTLIGGTDPGIVPPTGDGAPWPEVASFTGTGPTAGDKRTAATLADEDEFPDD